MLYPPPTLFVLNYEGKTDNFMNCSNRLSLLDHAEETREGGRKGEKKEIRKKEREEKEGRREEKGGRKMGSLLDTR